MKTIFINRQSKMQSITLRLFALLLKAIKKDKLVKNALSKVYSPSF